MGSKSREYDDTAAGLDHSFRLRKDSKVDCGLKAGHCCFIR